MDRNYEYLQPVMKREGNYNESSGMKELTIPPPLWEPAVVGGCIAFCVFLYINRKKICRWMCGRKEEAAPLMV